MGIDACPLGNHKLNTTTIALLAADLAVACDAEVSYGYQDDDGTIDATFDFVLLGIAGEGKSKRLKLVESDYCENIRAPELAKSPVYECFSFDDGTGCQTCIHIYKDCFEPPAYFIGRWGWFQRTFTGEHDGWEYLFQYRRQLQDEIKRFGGDKLIIYANWPDIDAVGNDLFTMPFNDIVDKVKRHPGFLDLSVWLANSNAPFMDEPIVFLDDFSVWPSAAQMTERAHRADKLKK